MLFPDLIEEAQPKAEKGVLGGYSTFELTREYPIDAIFVVVDVVVATGAAQPCADGLLALVKRVTMNAPETSQQRNRNVVDCTGPGLIEHAYHVNDNGLDRRTRSLLNYARTAVPVAAATYRFVIPIFFGLPNISDPVSSFFLLPVDRYSNNPVLRIDYAAQSEVDIHGTATLALTSIAAQAVIVRRRINRERWLILDHEYVESEKIFSASGSNNEIELPLGGYVNSILYRGYSRTSASPPVETRQDPSSGATPWEININKTVNSRFKPLSMEILNDFSMPNSATVQVAQSYIASASNPRGYVEGSFFRNFVNNRPGGDAGDAQQCLGSVLNLNAGNASGIRAFTRMDISVPSASRSFSRRPTATKSRSARAA